MKKYMVYLRVSTARQGVSGLGLDAQRNTVQSFIRSQLGAEIIQEFVEVESGKSDTRPMLAECLKACQKEGAILLVSTLSRLTRNLRFLTELEASGVDIRCADMPEANRLILHIMGSINQYERELISKRTSDALKNCKKKLGNPRPDIAKLNQGARDAKVQFASKMASIVAEIRSSGVETFQGIADCLNRRGYATRTGKQWFPASVRNLINAVQIA